MRHLPSGYPEVNTAWMWGALLAASIAGWLHQLTANNRMVFVGSGMGYITQSGTKNTLFVNDYGDYQRDRPDRSGGQSTRGFDRVVAAEMTDDYTYVRSDLSTAYNNMEWPRTPADTRTRRAALARSADSSQLV